MDHVFLFDNNSDRPFKTGVHQLRGKFSPVYLTVAKEFQHRAQLSVYAQCIEEQRANFNWIAFLDLDEYLVLRDPYAFLLCTSVFSI